MQKGFSIQLNFGSYGGFNVRLSEFSFGVCLGWVALRIFFFDVEVVFEDLVKNRVIK